MSSAGEMKDSDRKKWKREMHRLAYPPIKPQKAIKIKDLKKSGLLKNV